MSIEQISKTLSATAEKVNSYEGTISKMASAIEGINKTLEASSSHTFSAMGESNDKDEKNKGKTTDKSASDSYEAIKGISSAIFAAASEPDMDKRRAAIESTLNAGVTTRMASMESSIKKQNDVIARQSAEITKPRIEYLENAYASAGADSEKINTMKASWVKMPIDELDEEVERTRLLSAGADNSKIQFQASDAAERQPVNPFGGTWEHGGTGAAPTGGIMSGFSAPPPAAGFGWSSAPPGIGTGAPPQQGEAPLPPPAGGGAGGATYSASAPGGKSLHTLFTGTREEIMS